MPPERIADGFRAVGNMLAPVYLFQGDATVLLDAGMSFTAPFIFQQLEELLGIPPALEWVYITHLHYDHCGGIPYFKRRIPSLKAGGSEYAAELIKREKVVNLLTRLNEEVALQARENYGISLPSDIQFEPFSFSRTIKEGDIIDTGRFHIRVLDVPGHTKCSVAYFVEELEALSAGEAVGVPFLTGEVQPEFLSSYDAYLHSLYRMRDLQPRFICLAHGGVISDKKAREYMNESIRATEAFREKVEKLLRRYGDEKRVVEIIAAEEYTPQKTTQPRTPYMLNLEAKVRVISRMMNETAAQDLS